MANNNDDIQMSALPGPLSFTPPSTHSESVLGRRKRSLVGGGPTEAGPSRTATTSQIPEPEEGSASRPPQLKRSRNAPTPPPRTKAAMKETKKRENRPGDWHLKKKDIPKEAKGFKVSSRFFISFLKILSHSSVVRQHWNSISEHFGAFHTRTRSHLPFPMMLKPHMLAVLLMKNR